MQEFFYLKNNFTIMQNKECIDLQIDRSIKIAWEDRKPFDSITFQFGI